MSWTEIRTLHLAGLLRLMAVNARMVQSGGRRNIDDVVTVLTTRRL
jgi:hypothetical protein